VALAKSRLARWLVPATALVLVALTHQVWLTALGSFLVRSEEPSPAEMIVVLAGDGRGYRIRRAAELVQQGYAPKVLVSGPAGHYGMHECDLAIPYAVKLGYPAAWFIPLPHNSESTREEAASVARELARRNVRRLIVVTSQYHTRRAAYLFRSLAPQVDLRVVGAPDPDFTANGWWHSRQGRKTVLLEWEKTVATWLGM
jgi:uncharacterized SAM-binding protein YcdF (DUF218 family)